MASHCKRSYEEKEEKGELFQVDKTFSSSCQIPFPLGPLCVRQSKCFDAVKRMLLYIKHAAMVMVGLIDGCTVLKGLLWVLCAGRSQSNFFI